MIGKLKRELARFGARRLAWGENLKHGRVSYAQEGEDLLLWRVMSRGGEAVRPGVYVDVGANHPWRCSNTAYFYRRGWSGVVIDPNPDFAPLYARERPKDVFLNVGVGDEDGELFYHRFEEPLFNTFSPERARELAGRGVRAKGEPARVKVTKLGDALATVWPGGRAIDLLSVDAEGFDERLLAAHDYARFPVSYLVVEADSLAMPDWHTDSMAGLLRKKGFVLLSKLFKSVVYVSEREFARIEGR